MTEKCHPIINHISFSTENLFEDSCFRSPIPDRFFLPVPNSGTSSHIDENVNGTFDLN